MTPAIIRAAAAHGAHTLNKPAHDGEQQIQSQNPRDDSSDHAGKSSFLARGSPLSLSMSRQGQSGQGKTSGDLPRIPETAGRPVGHMPVAFMERVAQDHDQ
jgi:hypothetical protein